MKIECADRLKHLPPYLFAKIDQMKQEVKSRGVDILDFGVGDPDISTPDFIVEALKEGVTHKNYHQYSSYSGSSLLKQTIAQWFFKRFGIELNPEKEIIVLIGSKEGIAHMPLAMINPGEKVLYTTPGYPVYKVATQFAGGIPVPVPLKIEDQFLPKLSEIKENGKLFFFNYPNNPTSASASLDFFEEAVLWAKNRGTLLCHDAAYSEIYFGDRPSPSILEIPGAKDVSIEFHSLSKTFNMTGWRVGFAVGNEKLIEALGKIKTNIDSGQFTPIQYAASVGLQKGEDFLQIQRNLFKKRRHLLVQGLTQIGLEVFPSDATFYLWTKVPSSYSSMEFSSLLLNKLGIVTTPGVGFGDPGEGYIRFSLTVPEEKIIQAVQQLKSFAL